MESAQQNTMLVKDFDWSIIQAGETCEFNGNIKVFLLEGGEKV
jgi:hypothetical protein